MKRTVTPDRGKRAVKLHHLSQYSKAEDRSYYPDLISLDVRSLRPYGLCALLPSMLSQAKFGTNVNANTL